MSIEQFVPWGDDMDGFTFASHTSVISKELLAEKLAEIGVATETAPKAAIKSMDDSKDKLVMETQASER
jgi:hypothetical protein